MVASASGYMPSMKWQQARLHHTSGWQLSSLLNAAYSCSEWPSSGCEARVTTYLAGSPIVPDVEAAIGQPQSSVSATRLLSAPDKLEAERYCYSNQSTKAAGRCCGAVLMKQKVTPDVQCCSVYSPLVV